MQQYHDQEWGRPNHDSRHLFELLSLEIMQAGLSWQTVLNKRQAFKQAFHDFDYRQVQGMESELPSLMKNAAIIRNRRKLIATINNAKVINELANSGTTFDRYMWQFVADKPIQHHYQSHEQIPATTDLAKQISKQMKKDGFSFTGPVIIYSFMQAVGMVNDHEVDCFAYQEIAED
ncbi:DNA-3-methyladenine glycosylase 1 [Lentilactobacillus rapi DSM 19907 = JCM 15042]|nr:DNA-3-methyladenine glycosylase 1 [Lentilactobacillus rapi DSM 19907 = JCM 15042]